MCAHTQKAPSSGKNAKGALTQQCAQCELLSVTSHLSPFSLYPRGYFASQDETGSSSMQMNCSEEEELAAPSQVHFHDPHTSVNRRNVYEKRRVKGQVATEYLLLSVLFLLNLTEVWLVGPGTGKVLLLSLPLSLSELRPGPSWACSIVPEENCQSGLLWLNSESRSFIKELICYSLPLTHSLSFSHTLPFSTGSLCNTPTSFLGLFSSSLYTVFTLSFSAEIHPPPWRLPWLDWDIMWLSLFLFPRLCE